MSATSTVHHDESTVEASIMIKCPVEKVYDFYRDFKNLPRFLGDVMAVEQIDTATSRWTIQGPLTIKATWTTKVTEERKNTFLRYETVTVAPLRTSWEVYFAPGSTLAETEVREVMKLPLGRVGRVALAVIGKYPMEEVTSNLHRLKEIMETGKVTDTTYAVAGKFA
jgi:uncharacterized membrane protein